VPDFPRSLIEHTWSRRAGQMALSAPGCGEAKAWELQTKPWTYECAGCGKQTSVTAGTIMHHSKLPLTIGSGRPI
jgi:hypothetical protein